MNHDGIGQILAILGRPCIASSMRRPTHNLVLGGVALGLCAAGLAFFFWWSPREVSVDGLRVRETSVSDWAARATEAWADAPLTLDAGDLVLAATPRELGIARTLDIHRALDLRVLMHLEPAPANWRVTVDEDALGEFLGDLRDLTQRRPTHTEVVNIPGRALDVLAASDALVSALRRGERYVEMPFRVFEAAEPVAQEDASATFGVQTAEHTSRFSDRGDQWTRARNIVLAAIALDGLVLAPGEEFSFNEALGPRTFGRGFMPANELANGEVVTGIGGGICQVATALHEVALRSGLGILEHHPHSRRPSYAQPGIDTAVAWRVKDLRLRNTLPFHVRVRASASEGRLHVALWGSEEPPLVHVVTAIERGADGSMQVLRTRTIGAGSRQVVDQESLRYPVTRGGSSRWEDGVPAPDARRARRTRRRRARRPPRDG